MQKRGIVILGVSTDDVDSHQHFAQKYGLPFPLLADTQTTVSQLYGVWKKKNVYGKTVLGVNREAFLIDNEGIVRKIWHKDISPISLKSFLLPYGRVKHCDKRQSA